MFITQQWGLRKLLTYVNWEVIILVALVILLSSFIQLRHEEIMAFSHNDYLDPKSLIGVLAFSLIGFSITFVLGSSSKCIGVAILMSQLCGTEYFLWFFALDFAGYVLSPTHKCVAIGNRYFGTKLTTYYKALGTWALLLVTTSGIIVFILRNIL
jgi:hypothetical protein